MFTDRVKDSRAYPYYQRLFGHRLRKQALTIGKRCLGKKFDQNFEEIRAIMEFELGRSFGPAFYGELASGHPMPSSATTFVDFLDQLVQRLCDECRSEINYRLELDELPWRVQNRRLEPFIEES